jgi:hypothetical protein
MFVRDGAVTGEEGIPDKGVHVNAQSYTWRQLRQRPRHPLH